MVRAACSLSMILISDSWARIPLKDINGKMAEFKEQYKHYAPCFGQLILSNGLLENLRLYGPYSIHYKKWNEGLPTQTTVRDFFKDNSDHQLFKLIKILFPSNAGSLATQGVVGQKPFQDMIEDKPEIIGHLINDVFYRIQMQDTGISLQLNRSTQSMYNVPAKQLQEEQRLKLSILKYNKIKNNFKEELEKKNAKKKEDIEKKIKVYTE